MMSGGLGGFASDHGYRHERAPRLRDQRYLVYHSTMLPTAFENQGSVS